jgi:hypothetical protein
VKQDPVRPPAVHERREQVLSRRPLIKTPRVALALLFASIVSLVSGSAWAQLITEFSAGISAGAAPTGITAGPCGAGINRCLWYADYGQGLPTLPSRIGRITTDGTVTEFSAGISFNAGPVSITEGPVHWSRSRPLEIWCPLRAGGSIPPPGTNLP